MQKTSEEQTKGIETHRSPVIEQRGIAIVKHERCYKSSATVQQARSHVCTEDEHRRFKSGEFLH